MKTKIRDGFSGPSKKFQDNFGKIKFSSHKDKKEDKKVEEKKGITINPSQPSKALEKMIRENLDMKAKINTLVDMIHNTNNVICIHVIDDCGYDIHAESIESLRDTVTNISFRLERLLNENRKGIKEIGYEQTR